MTRPTMADLDKHAQERANNPSTSNYETSVVWNFPDETEVVLQFLDDTLDRNSWFAFRETYCPEFKHVSGLWTDGPYTGRERAEIPFSMRDIPIEDVEVDSANGLRYDRPDLVEICGTQMDLRTEVLDGSSVAWADREGNVRASWKLMFNVVVLDWADSLNKKGEPKRHPQPGDHILMKFRKNDWEMIAGVLRSRSEDEGVDVDGSKWKLSSKKANKKLAQDRHISVTRKGEALPLDVELYDIEAQYQSSRENFIALARAAAADQQGSSSSVVVTDEAERPVSNIDPKMMSVAGLKTRLAEAGVEIPARATRAELVELYQIRIVENAPF